MSDKKEFYDKLKLSLDNSHEFPTNYLFKFIVPTTKNQLEEVKNVFDVSGAVIETKNSKTNKYVSLSISIEMHSSDAIIEKYMEVTYVEGIISL
jgi:uncharacterized protein